MPNAVLPDLDVILIRLRHQEDNVDLAGYETIKKALDWELGGKAIAKEVAMAGGDAAAKKVAGAAVQAIFATTAPATATVVTTAAVGAFGSLAPVLAVWVGAAQVAYSTKKSFAYWDLVSKDKRGGGLYPCTCGKCDAHAFYLANRFDVKQATFAASLFVVPAVYTVPKMVYDTFLNSTLKERKLTLAKDLQAGALALGKLDRSTKPAQVTVVRPGCRKAQALIALLFGEAHADRARYRKTLAAILTANGYRAIAGKF
ncbi:hypothetical protein [Pseudoduganella chitinolytica]|uniref:DUF697 domain-containing protein n=1 Tax=Pseudoduganella chitinolytica TaxID=34070 RepID=A0ABY8BE96_9BURK|nr:hypothetical protein [Pseudoduganella chitinolytica]WEF34220.1 hypothetical protein PX653_05470 [Pseudoduganella chitinolytica]